MNNERAPNVFNCVACGSGMTYVKMGLKNQRFRVCRRCGHIQEFILDEQEGIKKKVQSNGRA